jgi:very-short-patch-repair endonuclease
MNQRYKNKKITKRSKFRKVQHKASVGENKIKEILKRNKIPFESEKTFSWLKSDKNYPLRLDFFLPKHNIAIEFDGIYHFEGSKRQKVNDIRKNRLCAYHKLPLLRIPYWESTFMENTILEFISTR